LTDAISWWLQIKLFYLPATRRSFYLENPAIRENFLAG